MNSKIFILKIADNMELRCRFLVQYICREMLINAYAVPWARVTKIQNALRKRVPRKNSAILIVQQKRCSSIQISLSGRIVIY